MKLLNAIVAAAALLSMAPAHATITTVYGNMFTAATNFDNTVTGAGGTVTTDNWSTYMSGTSINRGDYTIERNNGGSISSTLYNLNFASIPTSMTGQAIDISPSSTNVLTSKDSGIKLTFGSAINSIGFEVGDWATCCQVSNLYISFDGGAPILVGSSTVFGDQFLTNGGAGVFVSALDDSGDFTTVEFWGNGLGEYLVFGGTIRYALIDQGSLPVPEPGSLALIGLGLAGLAAAGKRKQA